ncbi:hypothetical protein [Changchengzhania lutea]|uniref:hypothetical protein n=1 Tax=Changchengzhania lutea TaxID=2049305 RepID=UPI00115E68E8|nr:hypothetical protein [Changchengzhania lutea]
MSRNIVSILLSLLFVAFLAAPTIISIVDDSIDISMFYASAEEEDKGHEKNKDVEILFSEFALVESGFTSSEKENYLGYRFKNYPKPHLNLISPPPETHIS